MATIEATGSTTTPYYVHTDHLGGSNVISDNTGSIAETLDYFPFGAQRIVSGSYVPQRQYIGEIFDQDSGLNYLNARYYQSTTGRFISQDPVFINLDSDKLEQFLSDPQTQNSYAYARNNPLTNIDSDGKWVETAADVASLGLSVRDFKQNPSLGNGFFVGLDALSVAFPVPALVGYIRHGDELAKSLRAVDKVNDTARSAETLHDSTLVCRGGTCSADRFESASGVLKGSDGSLSNISVTSRNGASEAELVNNLPGNYSKYGVTTVGNIRSMGGDVVKDLSSKFHSTINGLNSKQLESLFTPTKSTKSIKN